MFPVINCIYCIGPNERVLQYVNVSSIYSYAAFMPDDCDKRVAGFHYDTYKTKPQKYKPFTKNTAIRVTHYIDVTFAMRDVQH